MIFLSCTTFCERVNLFMQQSAQPTVSGLRFCLNQPNVVESFQFQTKPAEKEHTPYCSLQDQLDKWHELWHDLVHKMTKVTPFPPFLVRSSELARKSLRMMTKEVVKIARHPKESKEYKELQELVAMQRRRIEELECENRNLKSEVQELRENQQQDAKEISDRIGDVESLVVEFIQNRNETDLLIRDSINGIIKQHEQEMEERAMNRPRSLYCSPKPKSVKEKPKERSRSNFPGRPRVIYESKVTPKKHNQMSLLDITEDTALASEARINRIIAKYVKEDPEGNDKDDISTNTNGI